MISWHSSQPVLPNATSEAVVVSAESSTSGVVKSVCWSTRRAIAVEHIPRLQNSRSLLINWIALIDPCISDESSPASQATSWNEFSIFSYCCLSPAENSTSLMRSSRVGRTMTLLGRRIMIGWQSVCNLCVPTSTFPRRKHSIMSSSNNFVLS